jgi:hypothetical protein
VHGPEVVRRICEELSSQGDDRKFHELLTVLRDILDDDRDDLDVRARYLAARCPRPAETSCQHHMARIAEGGADVSGDRNPPSSRHEVTIVVLR